MDFEIDSKTLPRLYRVMKYRYKRNKALYAKRTLAWLYLFMGYIFFVVLRSWWIPYFRGTPFALFLYLLTAGIAYFIYVFINWLVVNRVVLSVVTFVFNALTLIAILNPIFNFGYIEYIRDNLPL